MLVLAAALVCRQAAAYSVVQLDAAASAGYSETDGADPGQSFTELRPALTLSFVSPNVTWRAGYVFAGHLALSQDRLLSISNAADVTMAADLSSRSAMILAAGVSQGGTEFRLTQRAPEAGQPAFRARENRSLLSATLSETYALQTSPQQRLAQSLGIGVTAPEAALEEYNATMSGSIGFQRQLGGNGAGTARDAVGGEFRSSAAVLRPASAPADPFWNVRNSLVARWSHDFTWNWTGQLTAGVEQVLTFADSYPLAIVPTGDLTLGYVTRKAGGALTASYGAAPDLETGTMSLSEAVALHGVVSFDTARPLSLAASAGFVHAEPLGLSPARGAAGTGNAAQASVGLSWTLSDQMMASARYDFAYQFGQPAGLEPLVAHVVLAGLTVRYSTGRQVPPAPALGGRVDGSDRAGFPAGGAPNR